MSIKRVHATPVMAHLRSALPPGTPFFLGVHRIVRCGSDRNRKHFFVNRSPSSRYWVSWALVRGMRKPCPEF